MTRPINMMVSITLSFAVSGCAIYYRDAETGAEHIWGIGHLATKVSAPEDGKQAVIRKATLAGVAFGMEECSVGMSAGWDQRERIAIYDDNTSIAVQRPEDDNSFLFKFGSQPPTPIVPNHNNNK
ncbi:MAG: hypothetical protein K9L79_03475 [Methylobacter tundripaludum]|nr:hypothetical protein [Methylobacter tundripaludum]